MIEARNVAMNNLDRYKNAYKLPYMHLIYNHYTMNRKRALSIYLEQRMQRYYKSEIERYMSALMNEKNALVIFGAGDIGLECFQWLESKNIEVQYFVDNDTSKQKMKLESLYVKSPEVLAEEKNTVMVLIATTSYKKEFSQQLERMGLEEKIDYRIYKEIQENLQKQYFNLKMRRLFKRAK